MSEVTVGLYVSSLFSLTRTNSFKQYLRRTSGFNSDFELQELMFRPNIPIYIQESIFKKGVLPGPASGLEPSQSSCTASALLKLLEYFRACESQLRLDSNDAELRNQRRDYRDSIDRVTSAIKPLFKNISKQAAADAQNRKMRAAEKDPSSAETRDSALINYLKLDHAATMFGRIGELARQALDDKVAFEPSEKEFTDLCKWLMGVITYVNGGRIQSCELVQEENLASSTRATADELYNVKLDRELLGQGQCQAIYIGRSKTQSSGKTAYISLILPKRFYDAVLNIAIIKKRVMGNPVVGRKFFTNFSGEGITLAGIYRHATFLQMFEIMGTRLTTT